METVSQIANSPANIPYGIAITILGLFVYLILKVMGSNRVKRFKDLKMGVWWSENQIAFVLNMIVSAMIWITSYANDSLTYERCALIGISGQFLLDQIMKKINGNS